MLEGSFDLVQTLVPTFMCSIVGSNIIQQGCQTTSNMLASNIVRCWIPTCWHRLLPALLHIKRCYCKVNQRVAFYQLILLQRQSSTDVISVEGNLMTSSRRQIKTQKMTKIWPTTLCIWSHNFSSKVLFKKLLKLCTPGNMPFSTMFNLW